MRTQGKNILSHLLKSDKNINTLLRLIGKNSSNDKQYNMILFQIVQDLMSRRKNVTQVGQDLKQRKYGWNHDSFEKIV